eukprot:jgi/Botrbrau1/13773/Bobra.0056s0028.1
MRRKKPLQVPTMESMDCHNTLGTRKSRRPSPMPPPPPKKQRSANPTPPEAEPGLGTATTLGPARHHTRRTTIKPLPAQGPQLDDQLHQQMQEGLRRPWEGAPAEGQAQRRGRAKSRLLPDLDEPPENVTGRKPGEARPQRLKSKPLPDLDQPAGDITGSNPAEARPQRRARAKSRVSPDSDQPPGYVTGSKPAADRPQRRSRAKLRVWPDLDRRPGGVTGRKPAEGNAHRRGRNKARVLPDLERPPEEIAEQNVQSSNPVGMRAAAAAPLLQPTYASKPFRVDCFRAEASRALKALEDELLLACSEHAKAAPPDIDVAPLQPKLQGSHGGPAQDTVGITGLSTGKRKRGRPRKVRNPTGDDTVAASPGSRVGDMRPPSVPGGDGGPPSDAAAAGLPVPPTPDQEGEGCGHKLLCLRGEESHGDVRRERGGTCGWVTQAGLASPTREVRASGRPVSGRGTAAEDEVVLTIGVQRPDRASECMQKLVVLGSQKLWELRDVITCPSDEKLNSARLRMSRPSAFFYIEGVFYNDMRHPDAIDISEPIRKFCEVAALDAPRPVPPTPFADPPVETNVEGCGSIALYRVEDMEKSFGELGLRVGGGGGAVYCHQGCCEHALSILDVRRIHPDDPQDISTYPLVTFRLKQQRKRCCICATHMAVLVTYEDKLAPESPAFWCKNCYEMLHYGSDLNLKYYHRVFDYHGG